MRIDRPLCFSGGLGIWTFVLGYLAIVEGAPLSWRTLLWATVLVMMLAGAAGLVWDGEKEE